MPHPLKNRTCRVMEGRGCGIEAKIIDGYAGFFQDRAAVSNPEYGYILVLEVVKAPKNMSPDIVGRIIPVRAVNVQLDPVPDAAPGINVDEPKEGA